MLDHARRRMASATLVSLATLLAILGFSAIVGAEVVVIGQEHPTFRLSPSLSPHVLSRTEQTPVKLGLTSQFGSQPGFSSPPAPTQVRLHLDRHLDISTRGLPACAPHLQVTTPKRESVRQRCEPALVGNGTAELFFAFPESKPLPLKAKVFLYNGAAHNGATRLWIYIPIPIPSAIIAPVDVMKVNQGGYGTEAIVSFPKVAGGYGIVERLSLNINREYIFKDQRRSVATFRCANGKFLASAEASFIDGTEAAAFPVIRPCAVAG